MGLIAIDPQAPVELSYPEGDPDPTIFKVRALTGRERLRVYAHAEVTTAGGIRHKPEGIDEGLRYGLVGWRNFKDAAGNEVEFTGHLQTDAGRLDMPTIMWLFRHIIEASELGERLKKK